MEPTTEESPRSWLKPFLKPLTPVFREVVVMSFFVNLLALAVPIFTMQVYNRVVGNNGISTLQGLVVGMILVIIFDYILRQSRARILQTVALRVDVDLGRRLFRKIMRVPLQTLEIQPSAYWSSLFRDVDMVRNTLSGSTALLVADLPFAILFLVVIFVIAAPVAWVLLVMLPVFMFVAWRSSNVMSEASGQERKSTQSRDSLVAEMIAGRTTIKALALDRSMEPVWEEKHAENIESAITRGSKTDGFSNLGASLGLITSLLLTTVGALAIIDQQLTMGALIATNMLSGRIMGPLNQLVGTWRLYSGFLQATERLGKVFSGPSEREISEIKLKKPRGALSIENVIFSYSPDLAPVVSGITVDIAPGGVHALVGRNGSGKTTLLKLIQGLYQPQKGRVTMDGADIAQFTRSELADWLGYVPQESVLFAGTVRDNIISRMPNATDEEVIQASTEAGVHQFIIDLPDGYATEIGEAGGRLSGGQRQRIAIARALVGNPPVVLLDEPSSSLDRHAETELKNTLVEIAKTRTVIMVSHSPTLLSACDFLYALDRGKLALSGPAREVLPRLFGGKPPPPKGDGPKGTPKGPASGAPNAGPSGSKQPTGYEAIMAKAGAASAAAPVASAVAAAPAASAPMHTASPRPPAAKLKAPAKLTPIEKAALAAQASATQTSTTQATKTQAPAALPPAAQAPKPKVKAAAMPRGKAPRIAKPTASTARPSRAAHPSQSVPQPHAHTPAPQSSASASTGPAQSGHTTSNLTKPTLRTPATSTIAPPRSVHAGAQLRSATPIHRAASQSGSAPSSLATPSLRGPRGIRARANLDLHPAHKPAQSSADHAPAQVKHKAQVKAGASLRPTTKSILDTWAEAGNATPPTPRKGATGRGVGARARSIPTVRLKGPVGE